jgi:hypothetical protein
MQPREAAPRAAASPAPPAPVYAEIEATQTTQWQMDNSRHRRTYAVTKKGGRPAEGSDVCVQVDQALKPDM